jgi:hypothetical protein
MRPLKPSPFFRPQSMEAPAVTSQRPVLTHARRRVLAWIVALTVFALAAGTAIYLAHPERWRQPTVKKPARDDTAETRVIQRQPGVADVEVQRGKSKRIYRLRQVNEQVVVEEVKPPPQKNSWWRRFFGKD